MIIKAELYFMRSKNKHSISLTSTDLLKVSLTPNLVFVYCNLYSFISCGAIEGDSGQTNLELSLLASKETKQTKINFCHSASDVMLSRHPPASETNRMFVVNDAFIVHSLSFQKTVGQP